MKLVEEMEQFKSTETVKSKVCGSEFNKLDEDIQTVLKDKPIVSTAHKCNYKIVENVEEDLNKVKVKIGQLEEVKVKIEPKVLEDDSLPIELVTFICQPDLDIEQDSKSEQVKMLQWINQNEWKVRTSMGSQLQTKLVTKPVEEDKKDKASKVLLSLPPTRDLEVNFDQQKILLNESEILSLPGDDEAGLLNESEILSLPKDKELQCKWKGCYQTYDSQTAWIKHIQRNHVQLQSGYEFTCFWNDCPRKLKPFNWKCDLLRHMRSHKREKRKRTENKCVFPGCNKTFSHLAYLTVHQRVHTGEKPFQCQFSNCFKRFSTIYAKDTHQRLHYNPEAYACQVTGCTKKFTRPSCLNKHMKIHAADEQLETEKKLVENKEKEGDFVLNKSSNSSDGDKYQRMYYDRLQCKWEGCCQTCDSQTTFVKHIEKNHVRVQRGRKFSCFWNSCPRKSKPFNWRYQLLSHTRIHSGERPYKCPLQGCNKAFSRLHHLTAHQRGHTGERPYRCQFSNCFRMFPTIYERNYHQRLHYNPESYACQVTGCSKKYNRPSNLQKHMKIHTVDEQLEMKRKLVENKKKKGDSVLRKSFEKTYYDNLQCKWKDCYQTCDSQTALVKHIKKNHVHLQSGKEFTCFWNKCPRKSKPFIIKNCLLRHMVTHTGEKPYKCPFQGCNKAFSYWGTLKIHQNSHTRTYLCEFSNCLKSFSQRSDMEKHKRIHHNTCKWKGCCQTYDSQTALVKHIKKNHIQLQSGKVFTCFWINCQRKLKHFIRKSDLLIHTRIHTGEKPYKCTFQGCDMAFSQWNNRKVHEKRHTIKRSYSCRFTEHIENHVVDEELEVKQKENDFIIYRL